MSTTPRNARKSRVAIPIAELETALVERRTPPFLVASDFIDTTDASNFEERLSQLSPAMRDLVEGIAKNNILTFDSIIDYFTSHGRYAGGWIAFRDWARRQPWVPEESKRMAAIMADLPTPEEAEERGRAIAEQGRILGILRVDMMRAKTDDERAKIQKEIDELMVEFEKANRA
jgi:hypothetical protein